MQREIVINGKLIKYDLQYKNVKNLNLRIKPSGEVSVSASKLVGQDFIDEFIVSKGDFILNALNKFKEATEVFSEQYFTEAEVKEVIIKLCRDAYPFFKEKGVSFPKIKFRKMVSRWGSCHTTKEILTFNLNLMYAPIECIEYVVYHEFTHFLVADHSARFYRELEKTCPDWKEKRNRLKEIILRR